MSTYLGQPLGYKSADTQTDRQKIPPKIVLKIFILRGWHICAIWHPDFLWNRCVSLKIGKTKIQFLEKNLALLWGLSITAKTQNLFPKILFCIFQLRGWHIFAMWHPDFLWNRCASLDIGKAKNTISANMSVCSCFCRKTNWSHKNFQRIGKEFDCFSKAFQRTW